MQVSVYELDNGLSVYLTENHESPTFHSEITIRAGSKDDPADATGLAHYLEHLLFKGNQELGTENWEKEKVHIDRIEELYEEHFAEDDPDKRSEILAEINKESQKASQYAIPNELDKLLSSFGATGMNAYTAPDRTVYYQEMPSNRLEQWGRIESIRFKDPVYRLFQPELEIVYEEKNRSMDNKDNLVREAMNELMYGEHPYGSQTAIGTIDHLKRPSLKKIHEFFNKHYVANNMAVALSGDFEKEEAIRIVDKYLSWLPSGEVPVFDRPMPEPLTEREEAEIFYPGEEAVLIGFLTQPVAHEDVDALKLVDMVMDNAAAGLINLNLNQSQKVLKAGSYPRFQNDAGAQFLWGAPKSDQTLEEVEQLLLDQVELVKQGAFDDWVLPAIIADFKKNEKRTLESNQGRTRVITSSFGSYIDWKDAVTEIARIEKLDKADVVAVANKYFNSPYAVTYRRDGTYTPPSVPKPVFDKIEIDRTKQSALAAEVLAMESPPIEPRFIQEGIDYQITELSEGVRLYYAENPTNDLFTLSKVYEMGKREVRELGVAAALLDKAGTEELTADELKTRWYQLAAGFRFVPSEYQTLVGIDGLAENFDETIELFNDLQTAPVSDEATLKRLIDIELKKREDRKRDFNEIFLALRNYNRYGEESPILEEITSEEIKALTLDRVLGTVTDLNEYEHDYLYVGTLPIETVVEKLRALRGSSQTLKKPVPHDLKRIRDPKSNEILYLDFETAQTQLRLEFPNGEYSEELFSDIEFFNEYFYGGMSGIVFQEMREARALAYSVAAYYLQSQLAGGDSLVLGHIGTQADKTLDALAAYLELWDNMPRSESRYFETKAALENQYRVSKIGFRDVLGQVKAWERLGIEGDPRKSRFESVLKYELDDLFEFYEANIDDRPKLISILGPSAAIDQEELKKYGELRQVEISDIFVD